jgi:superfamily I DNA and/or RNA helicase
LLSNLDDWKNQSVAIITPYKAQLNRLKQEVLSNKIERVEVTTIDGFQGREKDVIIFSSVRSNRASIGFLSDHRRLNVAITRSKKQLFIIGCIKSLEINQHWGALIMSLRARNLVKTV